MKDLFDKALSSLYKKNTTDFIETIEAISNTDEGLNFQDKDGRSIIFYTVIENEIEATKSLIKRGASVNLYDSKGWTPLHYSVNQHFIDVTSLLIENEADINAKDSFGNTIISRAVFASKGRGEIIELLLENGADPTIANNYGVNAIKLSETIDNYNVKQFLKGY